MKSKMQWIIFVFSLLTLVPLKLYSSIAGTGFEKSPIFFSFSLVIMAVFFVFCFLSKDRITCFRSVRNPYIGIISLAVSASFVWNAAEYIIAGALSHDGFLQTLLMFIFSAASAVTFIFIALNYFSGKNMFTKAQILILFPTLWFIIKMVSYLNITNDVPDQYDVTLSAFMLLFLFNHSQLFVTSTDINVTKRLFMFGLPSVSCSLMFCVPEIIHLIKNIQNSSNQIDIVSGQLQISTVITQLILGIYTCFVLIDIQKQIDLSKKTVSEQD